MADYASWANPRWRTIPQRLIIFTPYNGLIQDGKLFSSTNPKCSADFLLFQAEEPCGRGLYPPTLGFQHAAAGVGPRARQVNFQKVVLFLNIPCFFKFDRLKKCTRLGLVLPAFFLQNENEMEISRSCKKSWFQKYEKVFYFSNLLIFLSFCQPRISNNEHFLSPIFRFIFHQC